MDNAADPTVIIKTSINSLPIDIKTLIVKLAKRQDNNWWERYHSADQHVNELFADVLEEKEWRGASLNALFLVNKEWSDLAAVELFKNLSTRNMHLNVFKFIILSNRAHLVKSIRFVMRKNSSDVLVMLPSFINLRTIYFNSSSMQHLFLPSTDTSSDDNKLALIALSNSRIPSLVFDGCNAKEIITVLQACHRLISIEMVGNAEGTVEELNLLGEILSKYSLQKFVLDTDGAMPESWSKITWNSSTAMRSIILCAEICDSSSLDFLSIFSTSLNRLYINFSDLRLSDAEELPIFDKLQHLELHSLFRESLDILKFFKNSPLVSLQLEITNIDSPIANNPDIDKITQLIKCTPTLRKIEITTRFINPIPFSKLIDYCNLQNINITFTQWTENQALEYPNYPPTSEDKLNHFDPILETALADGQMKLKELRKDKDVEGMEEMYNNCKWLRACSAYMRD